jgi:glycosyltransferase involved in cell wall biosynthesis
MRVNLHDFSGHPFQVQLARHLAARGPAVLHQYSTQYVTGHGNLTVGPSDPHSLRIKGLEAARPLLKYDPLGRARFELSYAKAWQDELDREDFDVVVACNVPMFALASMRRYFARRKQPWIFWHQDIYSLGVCAELERKLPTALATPASSLVRRLEKAQVRSADQVVAIGPNFVHRYEKWGVRTDHVQVIPNWAPLDELVPGERDNAWAREQNLPDAPLRLLYAGTLGRKHNPLLLLNLLDELLARGVDAVLTVVSEGVGADEIASAAGDRRDVRILGYQPAEDLSDVLASADVLVALLEPDAAQFSIPSKVHSYLCAGRPTIALVPDGNPAAEAVLKAGGFVGVPSCSGARAAADWLAAIAADRGQLRNLGVQARDLAEADFDIERIGAQFEQVMRAAVDGGETVTAAARAGDSRSARGVTA